MICRIQAQTASAKTKSSGSNIVTVQILFWTPFRKALEESMTLVMAPPRHTGTQPEQKPSKEKPCTRKSIQKKNHAQDGACKDHEP
jgi:hypothetical protein